MCSAFVVVLPTWLAALLIVVPAFVVWGIATWQVVRAFDRWAERRLRERHERQAAELSAEGGEG